MLQYIRDKASGVIGMILVGIIVVVFALFGINQYFGAGDAPPVATINGIDVSGYQYRNALRQRQSQVRNMFGGNVPQGMFDSAEFKEDVLQSLIRNQLVGQVAGENGYEISDQQLAEHIKTIPTFQKDGVFSADVYDDYIARTRGSKVSFENDLRNSLTLDQVSSTYQTSAFVTKTALQQYSALENQKRDISFVILKTEDYIDAVELDDATIEAYFEAHKAEFMTPESVKLEYVLLDEAALSAIVTVNDDEIQSFYDDNASNFLSPESREVSHIQFKLPEGANSEQISEVEAKAKAALLRIQNGDAFAAVATELSEDDLTRNKGGSLGQLYKGDLDPAVDNIIFSLDNNAVSDLIKTSRGFQIVQVNGIKEGVTESLDQVKSRVSEEVKKRKIETVFNDKSSDLNNLNFEDNESLTGLADGTGLTIQQTDWLDRSSTTGIASDKLVLEAAFSDLVLNQNKNSDLIDTINGGQVILHLLERRAPEEKSLQDVRDTIVSRLTSEATVEAARDKGMAMVSALEKGEDFSTLATDNGRELRPIKDVTRRMESVPEAIRAQSFAMHLSEGNAAYSGLELQNGNFAVIALEAVTQSEADETTELADSLSAVVSGQYARRELEAMYKAMEGRSKITIFRDNMEEEQPNAY